MKFVVVGKTRSILTSTTINDLPIEVHALLDEFVDILVNELRDTFPPIRSISHHIDLIPRASFPNKAPYRLTPRDNEEIKKKV
jgi:hypothetical protein